jgi:AcrR family transcriptional regulator
VPTVPKTDAATIVRQARTIVARDGIAALTMESLAKACGVRASSLYGHFANRAAIVTEVATEAMHAIEAAGRAAIASAKEDEPLIALAKSQRAFAHAHPALYALLFATPLHMSPELEAASRSAVALVCQHVAAARRSRDVSAPEVLEGARLIVAFTNGFVSMELAGAFRMGGDIERAFIRGVAAIVSTFKVS